MSAVRDMAAMIAQRRLADGEPVTPSAFYAAAHQMFDDVWGLGAVMRENTRINALVDRYGLGLDSDVRRIADRGRLTRADMSGVQLRAIYAVVVKRQADRLKAALGVIFSGFKPHAGGHAKRLDRNGGQAVQDRDQVAYHRLHGRDLQACGLNEGVVAHSEISSVLSQAGEDAESPGRETDPATKREAGA